MEFQAGQTIIIQPYENESGISIGDKNKPQMQNKPTASVQGGSGIEGAIGNAIGGLFR